MNLSDSLKSIILGIYIIAPFIFALVIGIGGFWKSPIYLRRLGIFFSFIQFAFFSAVFVGFSETRFSILNISFHFDKLSSILILLTSFILFILSVISKTFILKSHKAFWIAIFFIFGLVNATVLSDNILLCILNIIWMSFLTYFLNIAFAHSNNCKKDINSQLKLDITIITISIACILFDFFRYFILNDIEFCFSKITNNLYHINQTSINVAFWGFLFLNLKLFNLIPFTCKNISNSPKINPLIVYLNIFWQIIIGCFLFFKTNMIFAYMYWDYQDFIICYLLFNLAYYIILSIKFDSVYKFLNLIMIVSFLINIFSVFVFSQKGLSTFIHSSIITIVSFSLLYFTLSLLANKFKTDKFYEFKKIPSKNHKTLFFIIFSILNFAGVPLLAMFSARFNVLFTMFQVIFEGLIPSIVPYGCIIACLFISILLFKVFHSVLIAPVDSWKNCSEFSRHQIFVLIVLCFLTLVTGFYIN